jgi:hypothetical protein
MLVPSEKRMEFVFDNFFFTMITQLKESHNSSFTDPDASHVGMLSSSAAREYDLVSSLFHLHGRWSLHVLHSHVTFLGNLCNVHS